MRFVWACGVVAFCGAIAACSLSGLSEGGSAQDGGGSDAKSAALDASTSDVNSAVDAPSSIDASISIDANTAIDASTSAIDSSSSSIDANAPDANLGPDAHIGCPIFATFCDDFETGNTSRWTGENVSTGSTLTVNKSNPHTGAYSLEGHVTGTTSNSFAALDEKVTATANVTYSIRAYVYSSAPIGTGGYVFSWFASDGTGYAVGTGTDSNWLINDNGNKYTASTAPLAGHWQCVEGTLEEPPAAGQPATLSLYIDDTMILSHTTVVATSSLIVAVEVGITAAGVAADGGAIGDVFIDDVAIAPQHIGCN
jgi:hypothetical protein